MAKANILDLLLNADESKIKRPTKDVEIKRLSEAFGSPFILTCEAIAPEKMEEIQENAVRMKGKGDFDLDVSEMQVFTVIEGVKAEGVKGLFFKNRELMEKFNAPTPKELVRKVLLLGEITKLYNIISDLSGFGEKAVEEVKN